MAKKSPASAAPSLNVLGGVVLLTASLWVARSVLIPVALAILLTFILMPLVMALQRRGLSRTWSVVTVALLTLVIVIGGVAALSRQLRALAEELPTHQENIAHKLKDLQGEGPGIFERLSRMIEDINADLRPVRDESRRVQDVRVIESKSTGLSLLPLLAGPLLNLVGSLSLVFALTLSMLFKREDLRNRMISLIGHGSLTSTTRAFDEGAQRISSYLILQLLLNTGFGFLFGLGLTLIGVPYALLWGFLAAVLRFIPYIGTWLGGAFPLLMSLTAEGWLQPVLVVALLVLLGIVANNVLEPLLVSRSTGVSPIALVVAAAFWTWLWGPIGLVLSTPMTVSLAVLGKYVPQLRFLDVLLGTEPALDPRYNYYQRLLARDENEAAELVETYLQQHTPGELCDEVLVPALVQTRQDLERGDLNQEDVNAILEATREIIDGQTFEVPPSAGKEAARATSVRVLGCPSRDAVDELALRLFEVVLGPEHPIETLSTRMVTAEVVDWVNQERPAVVCIAAVPPGGLTRVRYLCKRLRAQFPELPLVVGCWGLDAGEVKRLEPLRAAGVNHVASTMQATRELLLPILQALAPPTAPVATESGRSSPG